MCRFDGALNVYGGWGVEFDGYLDPIQWQGMAEGNQLRSAFHGLCSRNDRCLEDRSFLSLNFLLILLGKCIFGEIDVGFRSCRSLCDGFWRTVSMLKESGYLCGKCASQASC